MGILELFEKKGLEDVKEGHACFKAFSKRSKKLNVFLNSSFAGKLRGLSDGV